MRVLAWLTLLAAIAAAQPANAQGTRVKGTIESLSDSRITLATPDAGPVAMTLEPASGVMLVAPIDPATIPSGAFVGIGASPQQPDGSFKAVQIIVLPESLRGSGEGHRDWSGAPSGTMTNAAVTATVTGNDGPKITLATGGKSYDFTVPKDAKVLAMTPAERTALKAGMPVIVATRAIAGADPVATRVFIGKDGAAPPL